MTTPRQKKLLSYLVVIPSNTLAFLAYCHEITTVTSPKFKHLIWTLIVIITFELNKLSSSIWIQVKFKAQDCIWILIKILLWSIPNGQHESCFKCPNILLKISYSLEASSYFFWFNFFFIDWKILTKFQNLFYLNGRTHRTHFTRPSHVYPCLHVPTRQPPSLSLSHQPHVLGNQRPQVPYLARHPLLLPWCLPVWFTPKPWRRPQISHRWPPISFALLQATFLELVGCSRVGPASLCRALPSSRFCRQCAMSKENIRHAKIDRVKGATPHPLTIYLSYRAWSLTIAPPPLCVHRTIANSCWSHAVRGQAP
jgi:hypothetical protein